MVAEVEFGLEGLEPALKKLETLTPKLARRGLRTAVRKGANIVRDAARENAKRIDDPETPEKIWKNVAVQFSARESKRQRGIVMRVGVRGGARQGGGDATNPGGDTWYWRLVEFGRRVEFGSSRTAARPFLRTALTKNIQRATDAVTRSLNEEITKALREPL